jgi:hypothetical protein
VRSVALAVAAAVSLMAQGTEEDFHVYREPPRLLLTAQRQRLLERERERNSLRWQNFDALVASGSPLAEPGFALALHYRVARTAASGRQAVEWALGADDLRQMALVFDWCSDLLTPAQAERLAARLQEGLRKPARDMTAHAARVLAAIALADRLPDAADAVLREAVAWWRSQPPQPRTQWYAQAEFLHAIRDNVKIDLRESAVAYFTSWPLAYIAGFYPAAFPGPDNDLRIPVYSGAGEPDLEAATRARAAGLAMVALDTNAVNYQFLQGFLMNDRFLLRDPLGAPYEFLWANPYQPGLSYQTLPLVYHDRTTGDVFARTGWDEEATWIGYFEGGLQRFRAGGVELLRRGAVIAPLRVGPALITSVADSAEIRLRIDAPVLFVLGLRPGAEYGVEIDDQELDFLTTDGSGTLVVNTAPDTDAGVRIYPRAVN